MKEKISWKKILLEALLIVLSVLLALFINEWKSNHNEKKETRKMMDNIITEISNNQMFIDSLIPYHVSVFEKIQEAAINDSLEITFMENGYFEINAIAQKGVKQGDLQRIAWIVAKEEKISNRITFEESQILFSVYEQQSRVLKTIDRIIDILGSREIHRKELIEESVIVLAMEWNEMIAQEKELSYRYARSLKQLKSR
jgi:hypothetical protein